MSATPSHQPTSLQSGSADGAESGQDENLDGKTKPAQPISAADVAKYVVEQFKAEIEHTRSWPTKIMAFYVAICLGVVAALVTLGGRSCPVKLCETELWVATGFIVAIGVATLWMLVRNHWTYCKYRELQIGFQRKHLDYVDKDKKEGGYREMYGLPAEWFVEPPKGRFEKLRRRAGGVGYYVFLVIVIACMCVFGIWKA